MRSIHRDDALRRLICSAELVFDEIAVSLPYCPLGAPREWWHFQFLRGDPEATARLKAFVVEAYENRGAVWTCPGCRRANPEPQPPAGSEWTCPVCQTLARASDHESPILDTLQTLDTPIPPRLRRAPKRRIRPRR